MEKTLQIKSYADEFFINCIFFIILIIKNILIKKTRNRMLSSENDVWSKHVL